MSLGQFDDASNVFDHEADPSIFRVLEANVASFGLTNVTLVNKPLWKSEGEIEFSSEGPDSGRIRSGELGRPSRTIRVPTVRLREYINRSVDFLKLDIEGAEVDVILDCADLLRDVRSLFVEYHSLAHEAQRLDELIGALSKSGLRLQVHTRFSSSRPMLEQPLQCGMDLQLNVFGMRQ